MSTLSQYAQRFAILMHSGQTRRDGVTPYTSHLRAVADRLKSESEEVIATAWLHDVLKDTKATVADMERIGMPKSVIDAVAFLSKKPREAYDTYLYYVRKNPIARKVKIADMLSNLADDPTPKQIVKYARGLLVLVEEPGL